MRSRNPILKHCIATALLGVGAVTVTPAFGCIAISSGNWDGAGVWSGCTGTGGMPSASDVPNPSGYTISLNGVSAEISSLAGSPSGTLDDAGAGGGSLTAASLLYNTIDFTHNNTPITLTGTSNALGFGTISTTGNLNFTGATPTVYTSSSISITGTAGTPVQLSASGTVTLSGAGTYTLNYVNFASGTWLDSSTGTFNIANCTFSAGATVPGAWGCSAAPVSASAGAAYWPLLSAAFFPLLFGWYRYRQRMQAENN